MPGQKAPREARPPLAHLRRDCELDCMSSDDQMPHQRFVKALQREPIPCGRTGCEGPVEVADMSRLHDRVKTFEACCRRCGWQERITGQEQLLPPWDEAALLLMADEHLLHQQPVCPFDDTPVVFTSMPNPRRKARYRVSCFYCGREAEMDWPPPEAKR
ncbi:MAG TPA: hypothetical protein VNK46_16350 [Nitrospiraceae bacterium]|nr:hypothetical protein [Nitrospiraceae bacterium]